MDDGAVRRAALALAILVGVAGVTGATAVRSYVASYLDHDVPGWFSAPTSSEISLPVAAGGQYQLGCVLFTRGNTSPLGENIKLSNGTAAVSFLRASYLAPTGASVIASTVASLSSPMTVTNNDQEECVRLNAHFTASTDGTISPLFYRTVASALGAGYADAPSSTALSADRSYFYLMAGKNLYRYDLTARTGWSSALSTWTNYYGIVADPQSAAVLYANNTAGGRPGNFHRSTDYGSTWADIGTGLPGTNYYCAIDPVTTSRIYCTVLAAGTSWFYKSTDSGANFAVSSTGLPSATVGGNVPRVDPADPSVLFVAPVGDGPALYKSTDYGGTWAASNTGLSGNVSNVMPDPANHAIVYCASQDSPYLFKSTDYGATWASANTGLGASPVIGFAFDTRTTPTTVYAHGFENIKVYKSTNAGASWSAANTGLPSGAPAGRVYSLTFDSSHGYLYAGLGNSPSTQYMSIDGGASWVLMDKNSLIMKRGSYCTLERLQ